MSIPQVHNHESNETLAPKASPFAGEMDFDPKKQWADQIVSLVSSAMGERYKESMQGELLAYLGTRNETDTLRNDESRGKIAKIKLDNGMLYCLDAEGKTVTSFDITPGMKETIDLQRDHDCDICERRARRRRRYAFAHSGFGDILDQAMSDPRNGMRRIQSPPDLVQPPAPDPLEVDANRRLAALFDSGKATDKDILDTVITANNDEIDITAYIPAPLTSGDPKEFARALYQTDGAARISDLFHEVPDPKTGRVVNPFVQQNWNTEKLQKLIQGSGFWDANNKVTLKDITDSVYNDHYDELKQYLKDKKVPDVVLDLLDREGSLITKITGAQMLGLTRKGGDLHETYKNLKNLLSELDAIKDPRKVPAEYKDIYAQREKIRETVQVLGDYLLYSTELINLLQRIHYNPAKETQDRGPTMHEYDTDQSGAKLNNGRNTVIRSLERVFGADVEDPKVYSSGLSHFFSFISAERPVTFDDMNGETYTVEGGEWMTNHMSAETAYKLAYEQAEVQSADKGEKKAEVSPDAAKAHLNYLLDLGIACYKSVDPEEKSIKGIMDDLAKEGVEVEPGHKLSFSGQFSADRLNLRHALELKSIDDLLKEDSDKNKAINAWRLKFIRIGSVLEQKRAAEHQEIIGEKTALIKMNEVQAESVISILRESKQFSDAKLREVKSSLMLGIAVVLPDKGGALYLQYDIGNGFYIDFSGGYISGGAFGGAGLSKDIQLPKDITVGLHAGSGYVFTGENQGWTFGGGASVTKKFTGLNISLISGAGVLVSGGEGIPAISIGVGFNWADRQRKLDENLSKENLKAHVDDLDKESNPYETVKANPARYPELAATLFAIDNMTALSAEGRAELFNSFYRDIYKPELEKRSTYESIPNFLQKLVPTGAGFGAALVGGTIPVPYAYLQFNVMNTAVAYRIATNEQQIQAIGNDKVTAEILQQMGSNVIVGKKRLATSGEVELDPKTGTLKLTSTNETEIKFSEFNEYKRFEQLSDTLWNNAKIRLDQITDGEFAKKGLYSMDFLEAHGTIDVYIDPELKDKVVLVHRGGRLYISVEKEASVSFKRQDTTYPFRERGEVENTTLMITGNPYMDPRVIKANSEYYLSRASEKTEWVKRNVISGQDTPEARAKRKQNCFKDQKEYDSWWGEGRTDRLEFKDPKERAEAYEALRKTVTIAGERTNNALKVRQEVKDNIEKLVKDTAFIDEFRKLATEGFKYENITGNWRLDFPTLTPKIEARLKEGIPGDGGITSHELNAAMVELTMASFLNIHDGTEAEAQKRFTDGLEKFGRILLTSIFQDYYKADPEKDKKTKEAVDFIIKELINTNINDKAEALRVGVLFGSLVGMNKITGIRHLYNYFESEPKWGVIGLEHLKPEAKGVEGEVARFWIQNLSGYEPKTYGDSEVPPAQDAEGYKEFQDQIRYNLNSPLAVKLLPLVAVIFSAEEMRQMTDLYKVDESKKLVNNSNWLVVKRFLRLCNMVREATIAGKTEIPLDGGEFKIAFLKFDVSMGVYKECGNVTGLLEETFALIHEGRKEIYGAAIGEVYVTLRPGSTYRAVDIPIGFALPIPKSETVAREKPPCPPPPEKQPCPPAPRQAAIAPRVQQVATPEPPTQTVTADPGTAPTPTASPDGNPPA